MSTETYGCDLGKVVFLRHWRNDSSFSIVAGNNVVKIFPNSITSINHASCRFVGKIEESGVTKDKLMELDFCSHEIRILEVPSKECLMVT